MPNRLFFIAQFKPHYLQFKLAAQAAFQHELRWGPSGYQSPLRACPLPHLDSIMGQGQGREAVEAATKLTSPTAATKEDFALFPLFWSVPLTRKDSFSQIPATVFADIRKNSPQKFALLIVHVRPHIRQKKKFVDSYLLRLLRAPMTVFACSLWQLDGSVSISHCFLSRFSQGA